ncbi:amidohydrolase [Actinomadura coerulea]|uniref:Amidohydrolase n=1 Tax=Actinomadura coerulea TaxID=46159 RepID=A0A7X0G3Z3_9ACTN|nr:amidohydrolase [Actinomadura coerulea]MBB6398819.1 amidohydrolase [Actinomadura coerulea]GGP99055.1 peptidase [Actinomadura coerulea]
MSKIWTPGANASGFDPRSIRRGLDEYLRRCEAELIEIRRDLHAHPEIAFEEFRTTQIIVDFLTAIGLRPRVLPNGTGVICDVRGGDGPMIALRADIDALPQHDTKLVPYRSTVEGAAHNCGHDVHTTMLLGTAHFLAMLAETGWLRGTVRLIFQPAEELPGGARSVIAAGGLDGVRRIFALHCDPAQEVGFLGLRTGAITASYDKIRVDVTGAGGHTARPHLTGDLITAMGAIQVGLPAVLAREIDSRSAHVLAWGRVQAGSAANAIPTQGLLEGTLRCLDPQDRRFALAELERLLGHLAGLYKVGAELESSIDLPPTINEATSVEILRYAGGLALGDDKIAPTGQSIGGEDFSLYVEQVDGALGRFGVRKPGTPKYDLHQGGYDVDEDCITLGVDLEVHMALAALDHAWSEV